MKKMLPLKQLISCDEALKRIHKSITPIERKETIFIENALGRVLTEDLVADMFVPPFDRAAMDGYAVKAKDTYGASSGKPKTLKLVQTIHAGESSTRTLGSGECIQVATGSPIPKGADAVAMVEVTGRNDGSVNILEPVRAGESISPKGEDIKKGQVILEGGEQLSPARVGVLAALGKKEVRVYAKPHVAIVPTGTEIKDVGSVLGEGQVYDVNSYTLTLIVDKNGAIPVRVRTVQDEVGELREIIQKLVDYDMIVFSGGSSVGERDLLSDVIQGFGEVIFHGIQIKPGKPTLFALVDEKPVFGMPGYPTSCLNNAYLLLVPAIRQMARLPPKIERTINVRLTKRLISSSDRTQFVTVRIADRQAYPVFKHSGAITSMSEADGYIILPTSANIIEKGQEVTVFLFD
jgi:molybdenum cofactor synthesis domain-containing protein